MGNLKQSFRESKQLGGHQTPINPAIRGMLKKPNCPEASKLDIPDYTNALEEPSTRARRALRDLFLQAQGKEWRGLYDVLAPHIKPVAGGDSEAIQAYAGLVCEHVKFLNSLSQSHPKLLLPFSRTRESWPVLKSPHPHLSEDEQSILHRLEVGKESGRFVDRYCKWKPGGRVAELVEELVKYVADCKRRYAARHGPKRKGPGFWPAFQPGLPFDAEIFAKPLRKRSLERAAVRLNPLSQTTIDDWEHLIVNMLKSCFADVHCSRFLIRNFVTAPSRRKSPGLAKRHLIRRVSARLRSIAGVKAVVR